MKEIIVVINQTSVWCGSVTVAPQSLEGASGLPPRDLLTGGRLWLIGKEALAPLNTAKRAFCDVVAKYGFQHGGLDIVPREREGEVVQELKARVIDRGNRAREQFLDNYELATEAHIAQNPQWERLIREHQLPKEQVAARIRYDVLPMPLTASESSFGQRAYSALRAQLVPQLEASIAEEAAKLLKGPIGTGSFSAGSLSPVRLMAARLRGFRALDKRIAPVADAIEAALVGAPTQGAVPPSIALVIGSLLRELSDPLRVLSTTHLAQRPQMALIDEELAPAPSVVTPSSTAVISPVPIPAPRPVATTRSSAAF